MTASTDFADLVDLVDEIDADVVFVEPVEPVDLFDHDNDVDALANFVDPINFVATSLNSLVLLTKLSTCPPSSISI